MRRLLNSSPILQKVSAAMEMFYKAADLKLRFEITNFDMEHRRPVIQGFPV
jgi:hypothetical protein